MSREQLYQRIFSGRKDRIGAIEKGQATSTVIDNEESLQSLIEDHLSGKRRLGFYNKLHDNRVRWAVVEFEDHGNQATLYPFEYAIKYQQLLINAGIHSYIERSKNESGNCYHLWIFLENPIDSGEIHDIFSGLAKLVDAKFNPEVFPKSGNENIGNFMWLPLFGGADEVGLGVPDGRTVFVDANGLQFENQWQVLETIERAGTDDIIRLNNKYQLIRTIDVDIEIDNTADQPGLEKVIDNCPFIKYCIEKAATLSEPLWYAMVSNLCRFAGGREKIHEISKPYHEYSERETDDKIDHALLGSGPITYEKIKADGWPGSIPEWPKSPAGWGVHLDVAKKIEYFKSIGDPILRVKSIENYIIEVVSKQDLLKRGIILKEIAKGCGLGISTLQGVLDKFYGSQATDYSRGLKDILWQFESTLEKSHVAFDWFLNNGGKFYRDREHNCYLYYKDDIYRIDSNRPFKSLIFELADISESSSGGKIFFDGLANMAFEKGERMEAFSWQYTDMADNEIYLNLNNKNNDLIKITPGNLEIVKNGNNAKSVLLQDSSKILPIEYHQLSDGECQEAFAKLKELIFDNLACEPHNRYMYLSWALAYPLIGFFRTIPHMRFEGNSGSGKSRGMELLSYLIYGDTALKCATTASNYTDCALNPLILLDNIESRNLNTGLEDFIITAVTGIEKQKRKIGTDKENVVERVKTLINSSGIESLNKNEMINRTLIIEFDKSKYGSKFWNELVYGKIQKNRNLILSGIFMMISHVLERLTSGDFEAVKLDIATKYPNHSKNRADDYLAVMKLIADALLGYFEDPMSIDELFELWIEGQNDSSQATAGDTNPILQYLSSLKREKERNPNQQLDYEIHIEPAGYTNTYHFSGTAANFFASFTEVAKRRGLPMEYRSAGVLAKRFNDSKQILKDAGWELTVIDLHGNVKEYHLKFDNSSKTA
jgi:hypothetical protein